MIKDDTHFTAPDTAPGAEHDTAWYDLEPDPTLTPLDTRKLPGYGLPLLDAEPAPEPEATSDPELDVPAAPTTAQTASVQVDRDGGVSLVAGRPEDGSRPLSTVPTDTFYAPDLDRIARAIRETQANGGTPASQGERLYVDKEGGVVLGEDLTPGSGQRVSEITTDTFYSTVATRLAEERQIVADRMPSNTIYIADTEVPGWAYTITNEFGDSYQLFMWFEATERVYKVALVSPRLGGQVGVHDCHLYSDGTLCLTRSSGSGYPDMAKTYAKSALWTRGASCYRRGLGFQFNFGQG